MTEAWTPTPIDNPLYVEGVHMLDGLTDDEMNSYLEEHPNRSTFRSRCSFGRATLRSYRHQARSSLRTGIVKILAYNEKPGDIGGIGRVEHVHTHL